MKWMAIAAVIGALLPGVAQGGATMSGEAFSARFERGTLVELTSRGLGTFVVPPEKATGAGIRRLAGDHWAGSAKEKEGGEICESLSGLPGGRVTCSYRMDASGDLVVTQKAESPEKGVWGVEWSIENIPLDMNILVPAHSGMKWTRNDRIGTESYDYPMSWEAQLVVVEGQGHGFCVWADDAKGVFKRLMLERGANGWRLRFITMPLAPFEERTACESVAWRLNVYEGDWRIPAKRYRAWADKAFNPIPIAQQRPAWVRDTRACVIMPLSMQMLEALPKRTDPAQTLIYLYSWRAAGYDRDYPTYNQPVQEFEPFVRRAHELGFHVMLHVNYFGCDPLNPLYTQFEPYQVRDPFGAHEKQWWLWTRADPPIKFAYINPACKAWREVLVSRLAELCTKYAIDALHLDQTLCIYNDYNGLVDGMTAIEGNVALHRELREALPDVALSGEGLDEVTYRYEAFAQRHARGLDHSEGTFNVDELRMAHPISSYLLRPYTVIYGYLGYAPPTASQLYGAWNEAYCHFGVIPTLKPDANELDLPTEFSAQLFDEFALWQRERVDIDMDADWPPDVAFPYRAADGTRVVRTMDRRLLYGDRVVARTIVDCAELCAPGSIPGWRVYDAQRIRGLDPGAWYPVTSTPRDMSAPHVASSLPDGFTVDAFVARDDFLFVRTRPATNHDIRLARLVAGGVCGERPADGPPNEAPGELRAADGATFYGSGDVIYAHPPWHNKGSGVAYARISLDLPKDATRFFGDVAVEGADGRTDGVTFGASVRAGERVEHATLHSASAERRPLELDVSSFAGQHVELELSVDPGPAHDPTCDWARWYGPLVERNAHATARMTLAGLGPWALALSGAHVTQNGQGATACTLEADFPGGVYLLNKEPELAALPYTLAALPFRATYVGNDGMVLEAPLHACAQPAETIVGGIARNGLFTHPPNHGCTIVDVPMTLPKDAAGFHAYVGLRDGSKSNGVVFRVEVNGSVLARQDMLPGAWTEIGADLTPYAGLPVVLSLVTDSAGDFGYDWAAWGEPVIRRKS
ncbi:MAG: DUF6259 domain-containing protein [Candidatus Hydrogenedentes bacterium]|nr:DUF6259 domain-containing protein [Candidatus Hydrogenedentota bacterium]